MRASAVLCLCLSTLARGFVVPGARSVVGVSNFHGSTRVPRAYCRPLRARAIECDHDSCVASGAGSLVMAKENRRTRRNMPSAGGGKRKGAGAKPKRTSKGAKGDSGAKWLQVLADEKEVGQAIGSTKVVEGEYLGNKMVFILARYRGEMLAVSEACGRCKFPMIKGIVRARDAEDFGEEEEDEEEEEEAPTERDVGITCPLCVSTFSMRTGKMSSLQPGEAGVGPIGPVRGLFTSLMSTSKGSDIRAYQVKVTSSGSVLVRVD